MIILEPVGVVRSPRIEPLDDYWGDIEAMIELAEGLPPASLAGLDEFSHAEIIYHFHRVDDAKIVAGARHPRGNSEWPEVGIFAQRAKNRPNRLGSTIVRILECRDRRLTVLGLDAIDGTPVLDIKPVFREFLAREPVTQPQWSHDLMADYWRSDSL
jgi:tRNA-Thr(GGU) m(6)t(6)A37 methyltransferase TsaA